MVFCKLLIDTNCHELGTTVKARVKDPVIFCNMLKWLLYTYIFTYNGCYIEDAYLPKNQPRGS